MVGKLPVCSQAGSFSFAVLRQVIPQVDSLKGTLYPRLMIAERFPDIKCLPDEDKLTLMAELWQDVVDDSAAENPVLAEFVEQRWHEYQGHPDRVSAWGDVKARILASRA
jgi:hypothetical protein